MSRASIEVKIVVSEPEDVRDVGQLPDELVYRTLREEVAHPGDILYFNDGGISRSDEVAQNPLGAMIVEPSGKVYVRGDSAINTFTMEPGRFGMRFMLGDKRYEVSYIPHTPGLVGLIRRLIN